MPDEHESSVTVTLRDIYVMVQAQGHALLEIKSDLRGALHDKEDHETRLRKIEECYVSKDALDSQRKSTYMVLTFVLAVFGALITLVTAVVS